MIHFCRINLKIFFSSENRDEFDAFLINEGDTLTHEYTIIIKLHEFEMHLAIDYVFIVVYFFIKISQSSYFEKEILVVVFSRFENQRDKLVRQKFFLTFEISLLRGKARRKCVLHRVFPLVMMNFVNLFGNQELSSAFIKSCCLPRKRVILNKLIFFFIEIKLIKLEEYLDIPVLDIHHIKVVKAILEFQDTDHRGVQAC